MPPTVAASLVNGVYESLRNLVVRGRLAPGTAIVEADAAQRLGVSRTPVREALRQLRHEGLVVPVGGGERPRLVVAPLSAGLVEELYKATGALEGVAARNIAGLELRERRSLAAQMVRADREFKTEAAKESQDWDILFELHDTFHRLLRNAAASPAVSTLLEALRPQVDRYEWFFAPLTGPNFSPTFAEHDAIVREVKSGTATGIERAVRANWFNGGARLAAVIADRSDAARISTPWDMAIQASA
jgi:DNA-binding GntR family transcriptional regulator